MARLPQVLGTDDLALAELCAARLDGELVVLARGWVPIDEPDLPSLRARALGGAAGLIIERRSAAWVHGATFEIPQLAEFCVPNRARVSVAPEAGRRVREVGIGDDEITRIGGCPCTTPVRTAFDLLRDHTVDDRTAVDAVRGLVATGATGYDEIEGRLEASGRIPHKRLAAARLALVAGDRASALARAGEVPAQPSLTR